jgi:hypothetical protein
MKLSELRQIIKEEVRNVVNEATLISKPTTAGAPAEIKVNDYVQWRESANERGMRVVTGTYIGKVVKVLGSKNIQAEVVFPLTKEGYTYKVAKDESKRIPVVGEMIKAKYSWSGGGQGSGSQGEGGFKGTVTKVDLSTPSVKITIKNQEGKRVTAPIRDLSNIMILK